MIQLITRERERERLSVLCIFCADGVPHEFRGAVSRDVAARGVSLDDVADQAHGGAVGQCHSLPRLQTEPRQPQAQKGG